MAVYEFNKTQIGLARLRNEIEWRGGIPFYKGRRVIQRDSPIDGGVYISENEAEELVVQFEHKYSVKYKELILRTEKKVIARINEELTNLIRRDQIIEAREILNGRQMRELTEELLKTIFREVETAIAYDEKCAEELKRKYLNQKIHIDQVLRDGKGVCKHMALVAGGAVEKLIHFRTITGVKQVSIDRCNRIGRYKEGHAWVRIILDDNSIYIMDIAQGYLARIRPDHKVLIGYPPSWSYFRPGE